MGLVDESAQPNSGVGGFSSASQWAPLAKTALCKDRVWSLFPRLRPQI